MAAHLVSGSIAGSPAYTKGYRPPFSSGVASTYTHAGSRTGRHGLALPPIAAFNDTIAMTSANATANLTEFPPRTSGAVHEGQTGRVEVTLAVPTAGDANFSVKWSATL